MGGEKEEWVWAQWHFLNYIDPAFLVCRRASSSVGGITAVSKKGKV